MKILWLKSGPLHPLDSGGNIRTFNMLKVLKRRHEVVFLSLLPKGSEVNRTTGAAEYSHRQIWVPWVERSKRFPGLHGDLAANLFSRLPYVIAKYQSEALAQAIADTTRSHPPDLIVCDFLTPAATLFARGNPQEKALLFQHNVESLIWQRLHDQAGGIRRAYFGSQWRRMQRFEREICARFDGVVGVSEDDCAILRREFGLHNVLGAVPTGVDVAYFQPSTAPRKAQSLVFLGSMDWMPNVDGVRWFAEEILPRVQRRFPATTLSIVGRNPTEAVRLLASERAGIRVTGTVPDVRPHLAAGEVMIVPLRIGGGTRIKIYEGMATGIPVVSTSIGAEGLASTPNENILLADAPEEFAVAVCRLLESQELRHRLGEAGRRLVEQNFSWESATRIFEDYCEGIRARPMTA